MLPGYSPDSRTVAGTHTTWKPTASKVAQALLVCSGDVTTAIVFQPLVRAIARILSASVRVIVTESTNIVDVVAPARAVTRARSAESEIGNPPKSFRSLDTSITGARPRLARPSPVNNRSSVALRIKPSGVNPADRTAIASTRAGMESRLMSGRARGETIGVYAITMQRRAITPAPIQSSGRRRVAPRIAPTSAAGRYRTSSGRRSSCCTPRTCADTAQRVPRTAPARA